MPLPAHHVAVAENGGKIYVFGGGVQKQAGGASYVLVNNAWEYDPSADAWKALAAMPTPRLAAVAASAGGKIYVMGGAGNYRNRDGQSLEPNQPHRVLDINEVYDPASNTWAARQILPTPRNSMFAGVVNGKIYLIGGRVATAFATTGSVTDIVEEYDPGTDKWGFLKDRMPTPREAARASLRSTTRCHAPSRPTIRPATAGRRSATCRSRATAWPEASSATASTSSAATSRRRSVAESR